MTTQDDKSAVQMVEESGERHPVGLMDVVPHLDKPWIFYPHLVKLNLLLFGALLTQITNGYDGGMINNMQSIDQWQTYFDHPTGGRLGTMSNGLTIGTLCAVPFMSVLSENFGRRFPVLVGTFIAIVGAIIQGTAKNFSMFMGARILLGFGTGLSTAAAEIYLTECAYPTQRPTFVGMLQAGYPMGSFLGALITWGPYNSSLKTTNWSWRIPSLIQGFFPLVQFVLFLLAPESPRYLISKNKHEKAKKFFVKYHGAGDPHSPLVDYQIAEISATIEAEQLQKSSRWLEWFSSRAMIHRFCIVIGLAPMMQLCGNAIISYYLSVMLNGIGITSSLTKLKINVGVSAWGMIWDVGTASLIYRTRRRLLFMLGYGSMGVVYIIYTILSALIQKRDYSDHPLAYGAVVMIFAFQGFYHLASPVAITYYMEICPFSLRAKGALLYNLAGPLASLFNLYVNPIAMEAITWKYYIVWDIWLFCMVAIVYFGFPETHGLSLEEVAQAFGDNIINSEEMFIKPQSSTRSV